MANFLRDRDLPKVDCTRNDFYDWAENMDPTLEVVDQETVTVAANKIAAMTTVPRWKKFDVSYSDLAIAATEGTYEIFTVPSAAVAHMTMMKHSTAFAGGAISALTMSVGHEDESPEDGLMPDSDVFQAVANNLVFSQQNTLPFKHDAGGTKIYARAVATGANLDALTQGDVTIWLCYAVLETV